MLGKAILLHWIYLLSSVIMDGEDENAWKLEKWANFFKFSSCTLKKSQKLLWVDLPGQFDVFFVILLENCAYE